MYIPILLFIVGLILLIKGGDFFVDGATRIAHRFHVPELIIGATVVSIGTTLPEVMVSVTSAVAGHGEMAYGNAVGSIICNAALIAALTIVIRPAKIEKSSITLPVIFFFSAAFIYSVVAYFFGYFSRLAGLILFALFALYMVMSVLNARKSLSLSASQTDDNEVEGGNSPAVSEIKPLITDIILLVVGAAVIAIGADLLVDNGVLIAEWIGVPESVIALTFIALGTSLPELVTAITSLVKGHGALSLGNVIGANLFNLVLVSSSASIVSPFAIPQGKTVFGINSSLIIDMPVMLIAMAVLTVPALKNGKLTRTQGIILLTLYFLFCILNFII